MRFKVTTKYEAGLQVHTTGPWETIYVDAQGQSFGKRESGMPR